MFAFLQRQKIIVILSGILITLGIISYSMKRIADNSGKVAIAVEREDAHRKRINDLATKDMDNVRAMVGKR